MNSNFPDYFLKVTAAASFNELEVIQSLWSGYGKISRYQLEDAVQETVVVKFINLNQSRSHPRGWNTDHSHNRKVQSYKIETNWYEEWSHLCHDDCKIPDFIGSFSEGKDQWIIMEDLNSDFPLRKYDININEVKGCLQWLAHFHGTFLGKAPEGLWEVGTYWHLTTRPDELDEMQDSDLKVKAHLIDSLLNNCKFQTIIHGDAKLANFCFSQDGRKIAAVDFQYVGGGCGMKDVAYFLGSCLTSSECQRLEDELLVFYFSELKQAINEKGMDISFAALEEERPL